MNSIRQPVVAGIFYPDNPRTLADEVDRLLESREKKEEAVAIVVPHGSLRSSGKVAGAVYSVLRPPVSAVLVGPLHGGLGQGCGLDPHGEWATPLGRLPVDGELARLILKAADLKKDRKIHQEEHALEMQLPFLQRMKLCSFVPVAVGPADPERLRRIGEGIARAVAGSGRKVLLVASSNLTGCRTPAELEANDPAAIEGILSLDEGSWLETVCGREMPVCGAAATAVVMAAAKRLGAVGGRLVRYETAGGRPGSPSPATGYAGILLR